MIPSSSVLPKVVISKDALPYTTRAAISRREWMAIAEFSGLVVIGKYMLLSEEI
jgi:hypothetical protein